MRMLSVSYLPVDCSSLVDVGAAEKTRASTGVTPQRPQRCASTNSATAARLRCPLYVTFILIYQACFAAQGEKVKKPAHQPFRPSALSRRPFAHHLSRRPFAQQPPKATYPKVTYPKRHTQSNIPKAAVPARNHSQPAKGRLCYCHYQ